MTDKNFNYSKQNFNFTDAYVQVVNKDGSKISPLSKNYEGLDRSKIDRVDVIVDDKIYYSLKIKGNKLIYRKRSIVRSFNATDEQSAALTFNNPKRAIVLETQGKIVFLWDSGETKEYTSYRNIAQYQAPKYREDEK